MIKNFSKIFKTSVFLLLWSLIVLITLNYVNHTTRNFQDNLLDNSFELEEELQGINENVEKIDWNDYKQLFRDSKRKGFGEHGESAKLTDPKEIEENDKLFKTFGMSVVISDKISLNRSVPDFRAEECLNQRYSRRLPKISIVILFQNEIFSVFKRTLHSLYNRTPHQLIKEVVLVNDNSTLDYLYEPLEKYIKENFPGFPIWILNLKERHGIPRARMAGGSAASADILFMMESHMELAYNWLPPLLDSLIGHPKRITIPVIDTIEYQYLHYYANKPSRGLFDWDLNYNLVSRFPVEKEKELEPFPTPIMNGGVYAIHREYFMELGPYDDKLVVYGAENIEMSLKVWLCGGEMLEVPCSRVGHLFRNFNKFRAHGSISDYIGYNRKRVIEVWFEDYKKFVIAGDPDRYEKIDAGDVTKALEFKKTHECKTFKYFLEKIAPDLEEYYPHDPPIFASGVVQLFNSSKCWDNHGKSKDNKLHLFECDTNKVVPRNNQFFYMSYYRDIRHTDSDNCLDSYALQLSDCHMMLGNQYFRYNLETKQIYKGFTEECIEADPKKDILVMSKCDKKNLNQKWEWGFLNETALMDYENIARKIK